MEKKPKASKIVVILKSKIFNPGFVIHDVPKFAKLYRLLNLYEI